MSNSLTSAMSLRNVCVCVCVCGCRGMDCVISDYVKPDSLMNAAKGLNWVVGVGTVRSPPLHCAHLSR
jgi:succinate dehydrogenase hydrophobic anchor subunit